MASAKIGNGWGQTYLGFNRRYLRVDGSVLMLWRNEPKVSTTFPVDPTVGVIRVDRADGTPGAARAVANQRLRGAVATADGRVTAVLFSEDAAGGTAKLGAGPSELIVAGLSPGRRYRVTAVAPECIVSVTASSEPDANLSGPGGFVRIPTPGCSR